MLRIPKTKVQHFFDAAVPPAAYAASGDTVAFCCQDCYNDQIDREEIDLRVLHIPYYNPVTGPLYINDAHPGDVLKVEILQIRLPEYGVMSVRDGTGSYCMEGSYTRLFPIENNEICFDAGIRLPVRPMIGTIGTAPAQGTVISETPGEHGGNLDIKDLGEGVTLYLPVAVEGALLSMGDIHALQGDGETAICGLETAGEITVRVTVCRPDSYIPTPFIVTKDSYLTTAADASLDKASIAAARKMHRFLQEYSPLNDKQCAMLLSLQGDLRISQIVNPAKGCVLQFPKGIAGEQFDL